MNPTPPNPEPMSYNAVLLGATGLVGSAVLQELMEADRCQHIVLLTRKSVGTLPSKVHEIVVDFDQLSDWSFHFKPDVLINCIGTTRKKTPNLPAYEAIDIGIPVSIANRLIPYGCNEIHAVSSVGAHPKASNFYLKIKGTLEEALMALPVDNVSIYRPSMLMGNRKEFRFGESIGRWLVPLFDLFTFGGKYHSIQASAVAKSIVSSLMQQDKGRFVYHYQDMKQNK